MSLGDIPETGNFKSQHWHFVKTDVCKKIKLIYNSKIKFSFVPCSEFFGIVGRTR